MTHASRRFLMSLDATDPLPIFTSTSIPNTSFPWTTAALALGHVQHTGRANEGSLPPCTSRPLARVPAFSLLLHKFSINITKKFVATGQLCQQIFVCVFLSN